MVSIKLLLDETSSPAYFPKRGYLCSASPNIKDDRWLVNIDTSNRGVSALLNAVNDQNHERNVKRDKCSSENTPNKTFSPLHFSHPYPHPHPPPPPPPPHTHTHTPRLVDFVAFDARDWVPTCPILNRDQFLTVSTNFFPFSGVGSL